MKPESRKISFDGWVLQVDTGELRRGGRSTRLQEQPLQVLLELVAQPGGLITREQLIARLWPKGVVDFDAGLNSVIRKLRAVLEDDSEAPRYIETVPRKGYRFIATLDPVATDEGGQDSPFRLASDISNNGHQVENPVSHAGLRKVFPYLVAAVASAVAILILLLGVSDRVRQAARPLIEPEEPPAAVSRKLTVLGVLPLRTAQSDERAIAMGEGLAALIRERLDQIEKLAVVSDTSSVLAQALGGDVGEIAGRLRASYLLRGTLAKVSGEIRIDAELIDRSGATIWSQSFTQAASTPHVLAQDLALAVAESLGQRIETPPRRTELAAYEIFARAERLLANERVRDAQEAAQLFARATELDPEFARAYVGIAAAAIVRADITGLGMADAYRRAEAALARALELDPMLGEAWIQRARITTDFAQAEQFYRRGLELAPGYSAGYDHFADFLADRHRRGEASAIVDLGLQLDPLSLGLRHKKAVMMIFARNDVDAHDALLRESLAMNPNHARTLSQLMYSRYIWTGELADALHLAERMYAHQPESPYAQAALVAINLDLGAVDTASRLVELHRSNAGRMELAQFRKDLRQAAEFARNEAIRPRDSSSPVAEAIRDGALLGGFDNALARLQDAYEKWDRAPITNRSTALVYAHALLSSGEEQRGRQLAQSTLALIDAEGAGRPHGWFCRERATALAVLGRTEEALAELALSVELKRLQRWWYTTEIDPAFAVLRSDPQFQRIKRAGQQHLVRQRELRDAQRRRDRAQSIHDRQQQGASANS